MLFDAIDFVSRHAEPLAAILFIIIFLFGLVKWIAYKSRHSVKGVLLQVLYGLRRPFTWCATEFSEYRRVSRYKHRLLNWDDLPQDSKDKVGFQDLNESARRSMRIRDLPDSVRMEMRLKDLPQDEKYRILERLILPKIQSIRTHGELSLLDDRDSPTLSRGVWLTVQRDNQYIDMGQSGVQLPIKVEFVTPSEEIACQLDQRIGFRGENWTVVGRILRHSQLCPGSRRIEVWVDRLYFEDA